MKRSEVEYVDIEYWLKIFNQTVNKIVKNDSGFDSYEYEHDVPSGNCEVIISKTDHRHPKDVIIHQNEISKRLSGNKAFAIVTIHEDPQILLTCETRNDFISFMQDLVIVQYRPWTHIEND
jgi:hypothetical protein